MCLVSYTYNKLHNYIHGTKRKVKAIRANGGGVGNNVDIINCVIDDRYARLLQIGDNVTITHATVLLHDASMKKFTGYTKVGRVLIGNNVFIGYGVIILPNTHIGDNVIIGAGAIVKGNIPDDSLVIGNPTRIIGKVSDYIAKSRKQIEDSEYLDLNKAEDIQKMNINMTMAFID